jgi:hypothetical protein
MNTTVKNAKLAIKYLYHPYEKPFFKYADADEITKGFYTSNNGNTKKNAMVEAASKKSKILIAKALMNSRTKEQVMKLLKEKSINAFSESEIKKILNSNTNKKATSVPAKIENRPDTKWNPPVNVSTKNLYERLNFVPGRADSKFLNATRHVEINKSISHGTYGEVFSLKVPPSRGFMFRPQRKYVMKVMKLADPQRGNGIDIKSFFTEVRIGSLKGIEKVGPRIYAWKLTRDKNGKATHGSYIMDSFDSLTPPGCTFDNLYFYIKWRLRNKGSNNERNNVNFEGQFKFNNQKITHSHILVEKLREALLTFWKVTKGYHGDLPGNIGVIHSTARPSEIKRIVIFDYAAHKVFKSSRLPNTFKNFIELINKEGKNTQQKVRKNKLNIWMGAPLIAPRHRQAYRSNTNVLRTIHKIIPSLGNNKRTLMNMLLHEPKKRTWRNMFRMRS